MDPARIQLLLPGRAAERHGRGRVEVAVAGIRQGAGDRSAAGHADGGVHYAGGAPAGGGAAREGRRLEWNRGGGRTRRVGEEDRKSVAVSLIQRSALAHLRMHAPTRTTSIAAQTPPR